MLRMLRLMTLTTTCTYCRAETADYRMTPSGPKCTDHVECAWRRWIRDSNAHLEQRP